MWTQAGLDYVEEMKENKMAPAPKPGEHYVVIDCQDPAKYLSYPHSDTTELLRHNVVMVRWKRPHVPRPTATPLPTTQLSEEERGRMFSVYLRPWVLSPEHASAHVPLLADIDILVSDVLSTLQFQRDVQENIKRRRLRAKQHDPCYTLLSSFQQYPKVDHTGKAFQRSYGKAWKDYRCKHVVSRNAAKIIQQFAASHLADSLEAAEDDEGEWVTNRRP